MGERGTNNGSRDDERYVRALASEISVLQATRMRNHDESSQASLATVALLPGEGYWGLKIERNLSRPVYDCYDNSAHRMGNTVGDRRSGGQSADPLDVLLEVFLAFFVGSGDGNARASAGNRKFI